MIAASACALKILVKLSPLELACGAGAKLSAPAEHAADSIARKALMSQESGASFFLMIGESRQSSPGRDFTS